MEEAFDALRRYQAAPSDSARALEAGQLLAASMAGATGVTFTRIEGHLIALETHAACSPLRSPAPVVLLRRTATLLETGTTRILVDPVLPAVTPMEERARSLWPDLDARVAPMAALAPETITDVVLTCLHHQPLQAIFGTLHEETHERIARTFPNARLHVGAADWQRSLAPEEVCIHTRDLFDELDPAKLSLVERALKLAEGIVLVPTPGLTEGHLSVVFKSRERVHVATSNVCSREALSPYAARLEGLREYARLRDVDVAPRGEVRSGSNHMAALRFERHVADRDPSDPRFHLVWPSSALHLPMPAAAAVRTAGRDG